MKITLGQMNCVQKVMRYKGNGIVYHTWTCTEDDCSTCTGSYCHFFNVRVSSEGEGLDLPPFSDCRYGDMVQLEKVGGNPSEGFKQPEIAIIGWQGRFLI